MAPALLHYRCLGCAHEFDAAPGPTLCPACGHLYVGRLSWYGLVTQAKAEASVRDRLKAAGHRALFLHYLVAVKRTNRTTPGRRHSQETDAVKIKRPVLPSGYVFARLTTDDIAPVCGLPGVVGFVGTQEGAGRIPDSEMEDLLGWGDADGVVSLLDTPEGKRPALKVGSIVRSLSGPFQGFEGPVERDDAKPLVRVILDIFGRKTPVDLPYEAVEVIWKAA